MRALRIGGPGRVDLVEAPMPRVGEGEALVRVAYAGICATDRRLAQRGSDPPRVPGHEASGWLEDGTPVGIHPDVGCGACLHCRGGFDNRCARRVSIGIDRDGGMAEWVAVPRHHLFPIDGIDLDVGALLEPLACCVHACSLLAVDNGAPSVVVGAGPMGILAMWVLRAAGTRVAVCDTSDVRRRSAAVLGADGTLEPDEDPASVLGERPLLAVVTAPGPRALRWALQHMVRGGRVHVFAGSPTGNDIDANVIHYGHLSVVGSTGSTMGDYRRAYELVLGGSVPLADLPRAVVGLDEAVASLLETDTREALRTLVEPGRSAAA